MLAEPAGPTCHTGAWSCFAQPSEGKAAAPVPASAIVARLHDLIAQRRAEQTEGSYTVKLLNSGVDRIAKKVGEEATEVVIGAMKGDRDELRYELADLDVPHTCAARTARAQYRGRVEGTRHTVRRT